MANNRYYEAHVTMLGLPKIVQPIVEESRWKFSCIDGDANLGDGVKCYATRQFKGSLSEMEVVDVLKKMADRLSEYNGIQVIRRKVEVVIYDDRSELVRPACEGGCPECHTDDLLPIGLLGEGPKGVHGPLGFYDCVTPEEMNVMWQKHLAHCNQCREEEGLPLVEHSRYYADSELRALGDQT